MKISGKLDAFYENFIAILDTNSKMYLKSFQSQNVLSLTYHKSSTLNC